MFESEDSATVLINYFAADPFNKDGVYRQLFHLKKINSDWLIVHTENQRDKLPRYSEGEKKTKIKLTRSSGNLYMVEATINNSVKTKFILDSGASEITISPEVATWLMQKGTLTKMDYLGEAAYSLANGSVEVSHRVLIREVKIGGFKFYNIPASINSTEDAPMLLGQALLKNFGKIQIDYNTDYLIIER